MPVVTVPTLGQYGLIRDQPPEELPLNAFSNVRNMRFRNGKASRFNGHAQLYATPSVAPYFVWNYETSTSRYVIHAGLAAVYADDGTTRANITGSALAGGIDDRWTGGVLGGILLLNNGVNPPMYWGGTGTLATLPGWNAAWSAKSIGVYRQYIVTGGFTKSGVSYPHMVKWSNAAEPGTAPTSWNEADPTIDAGEKDLSDTPDLIVGMLALGDSNIIYKEQSMYSMRWIGGDYVFEFNRLPGRYGMLTRGCAADTPKGHVVLCAGDVVLHQGQGEPQSILTGKIKDWLFNEQIDSSNYKRCFVVSNAEFSEVWICYPYAGSAACTKALVWNWNDGTFSPRDLPNATYASSGLIGASNALTWGADTLTWGEKIGSWNKNDATPAESKLVISSTSPALYLADSGATFAGTAITGQLERTGLAMDDPNRVKTLKTLFLRVDAAAGTVLSVELGGAMTAGESPTYGSPMSFVVGSQTKVDGFATGRFLAYRITSIGNQAWSVKSLDLDYAINGLY